MILILRTTTIPLFKSIIYIEKAVSYEYIIHIIYLVHQLLQIHNYQINITCISYIVFTSLNIKFNQFVMIYFIISSDLSEL